MVQTIVLVSFLYVVNGKRDRIANQWLATCDNMLCPKNTMVFRTINFA